MARNDGRSVEQLRDIKITRGWLDHAEGSVLVEFGKTRVLCVASFTPGVPRWLKDSGNGWVTSEYSMLPRATHTRSDRESVKGKLGGRTQEISRLIGRSLRGIVDMKELGENTIVIDCDVLQADGGTRTAAITGAYVALADAISWAQKAGHIPGAVNFEWTAGMDPQRAMRMRLDIQQQLTALGITADKEIITHCQTHHRSGFTYLVAKALGYPRLKAYAGSWGEWGNHPDTPVER